MTTSEKDLNNLATIEAIESWQNNSMFHPLTCGVDSRHEVLRGEIRDGEVKLCCPTCGWVQNGIPAVIRGMTGSEE